MKKESGSGLRNLFGNSVIYSVGILLKKALGFFLIPLYTHQFTNIQYGKLGMIYLFSSILTIFFYLGLGDAFFKQFTNKKYREERVFSRFITFRVLYTSFFIFFLIYFSEDLSLILLKPGDGYLIQLAILSIWIESLTQPVLQILRIKNRAKYFVTISTIKFCSNIGLNLLFILHFKMGLGGVMLGNLCSELILLLIVYPKIHSYITSKFKWGPVKELLNYGLPLLPLSIIIWFGLELADRWIIKWLLGLGETGIYTLGYQFGAVMGILVHGFRKSWIPFFFNNPDAKDTFVRSATIFTRLSLILWGVLSFFTPEIFMLMVDKTYYASIPIVSIIALSQIFFGLEEIFTAGFLIKSKTKLLIPLAFFPLLVNISLNIYLIPRIGIIGAAYSTLIAYVIFALSSHYFSNRFFPVSYRIKTIFLDILTGVVILLLTRLSGNTLPLRITAFLVLSSYVAFRERKLLIGFFKN